MKKNTLLFILFFTSIKCFSQGNIGIGTNSPNNSAILDVTSTTKGLLVPRMTAAQRGVIASPAVGLLVYDMDVNAFYYYNGSSWNSVNSGGSNGNGTDWSLTGNSGTTSAANFLGTTDNQPLVIRVNNQRQGFFDTKRNVFLGRLAGNSLSANPTPSDWGAGNIAIGASALENNVNGYGLVAIGDSALWSNTGYSSGGISYGLANTAVGTKASRYNISGSQNTAIGYGVLEWNTGASYNTGVGYNALSKTNGGSSNTAIGRSALTNNTNGSNNTSVGSASALSNILGNDNTSLGYQSFIGGTLGSRNISIGSVTLANVLSGDANIAIGYAAMRMATEYSNNIVAIGDSALYNNGMGAIDINQAKKNTAIGSKSLFANTTGNNNTATGYQSLKSNTTGGSNSAFGTRALEMNTTGASNTALGNSTLLSNTTGYNNIAVGGSSLLQNTVGYENIAIGILALRNNSGGSKNIAIGNNALHENGTRAYNIAVGDSALFPNGTGASGTEGNHNVALGIHAGRSNDKGSYNVFIGNFSGLDNTSGTHNVALGYTALQNNLTATNNTALGNRAGETIATGGGNTMIGSQTDVSTPGVYNATAIGYDAVVNASNKIRLGNNNVTVIEGTVLYTTSDGRFKQNIKENVPGLELITSLKPLTYNYKSYEMDKFLNQYNSKRAAELKQSDYAEAESIVHMGFIAQDVEKLIKEKGYTLSLVHTPTNPTDNYSIAYGELVVPLVKAVQEQQKMIDELKREIEYLKKSKN